MAAGRHAFLASRRHAPEGSLPKASHETIKPLLPGRVYSIFQLAETQYLLLS
jgi:hypothetical protein